MKVKALPNRADGVQSLQGINFAYTGVSQVSDEVAEIFNHNPKTIAFGNSSTSYADIVSVDSILIAY